MMSTATLLLLSILAIFTLQQLVLAVAGLFRSRAIETAVTQYRRIAVLIFADGNSANLRPLLLRFVDQDYPSDRFSVHLVTADRNKINQFSDLPVKVLLSYATGKTAIVREAMQQITGVFDVAVCIHQPVSISEKYLSHVNTGFQQGSYFTSPWLSREKSHCEIIPAPLGGFSTLNLSVPLNEYIYTLPYLWLKQQVDEMKDAETFHQSLQYRILEQGKRIELLSSTLASLDEDATTEPKGILNRIQLCVIGIGRLLRGKPAMLFTGIWKIQPKRAAILPGLMVLTLVDKLFVPVFLFYVLGCVLIAIKSPQFELRRTTLNFVRQFGFVQMRLRKKRTALSVSTAE